LPRDDDDDDEEEVVENLNHSILKPTTRLDARTPVRHVGGG